MTLRTQYIRLLHLYGEKLGNGVAGTTADIVVLERDNGGKISRATGTDVPVDTTAGYAKGCIFIDTNASAGVSGRYENVGTTTSCNFDGLTATADEIIAATDVSVQAAKMAPSTVMLATLESYQSSVIRTGDIIKTTIAIDLTGAKSTTTDKDVIGDTGACHIGQITAAVNGTIYKGQVSCGEVPATGVTDIDIYSSTVATGAYDADASGLTGAVAILTSGGAHAIATVKPLTALPAANAYLYLASGAAGTPGTYTAGRLLIELWGTVA